MTDLVAKYRSSKAAAAWRVVRHVFPRFASKWSPFFPGEDGSVLWSQGFGRVAYIKGDRALLIGWGIGADSRERRVFLSQVHAWESPHARIPLTPTELTAIADLIHAKYTAKGEKVNLQ